MAAWPTTCRRCAPTSATPRRTKVIGRFPGETSCLSLCWAVLDLLVGGARGLGLTDIERHELARSAPNARATNRPPG